MTNPTIPISFPAYTSATPPIIPLYDTAKTPLNDIKVSRDCFSKSRIYDLRGGAQSGSNNSETYYDLLHVSQEASAAEIKKSYRKLARKYHPDKNGGKRHAKFDQIREAYDTLVNEEQRSIYDARISNKNNPFASFHPFFGNSNSMFREFQQKRQQHNRSLRFQLQVTLEELYNGMERELSLRVPKERGMFRQQFDDNDIKRLQVHVERGMIDGQTVVLPGELDSPEGGAPGDVILELVCQRHTVFTRKGNDLAMKINLAYSEAVLGFKRNVRFLNGELIKINYNAGSNGVLHAGSILKVKGMGMPVQGKIDEFGDLFVEVDVELPRDMMRLSQEERSQLGELLAKAEGRSLPKRTDLSNLEEDCFALEPSKASDYGANYVPPSQDDTHHFEEHHNNRQGSAFYSSFHFPSSSSENMECQQM